MSLEYRKRPLLDGSHKALNWVDAISLQLMAQEVDPICKECALGRGEFQAGVPISSYYQPEVGDIQEADGNLAWDASCLLYTSPSPRDRG